MSRATAPAPSPPRRWAIPLVLTVLGVALVAGGELGVSQATTNYDHALAHDCSAGGCRPLGPLSQQTDYLEAESAVAAGIVVLALALYTAVRARARGPAPAA